MTSCDSLQQSFWTGQTSVELWSGDSQANAEMCRDQVARKLSPYIETWQNAEAGWQLIKKRPGDADWQPGPELDSWLKEKRALIECGTQLEQAVTTLVGQSDRPTSSQWTTFLWDLAHAKREFSDQESRLRHGATDPTPHIRIYNATEDLKKSMVRLLPSLTQVWQAAISDDETVRSDDTNGALASNITDTRSNANTSIACRYHRDRPDTSSGSAEGNAGSRKPSVSTDSLTILHASGSIAQEEIAKPLLLGGMINDPRPPTLENMSYPLLRARVTILIAVYTQNPTKFQFPVSYEDWRRLMESAGSQFDYRYGYQYLSMVVDRCRVYLNTLEWHQNSGLVRAPRDHCFVKRHVVCILYMAVNLRNKQDHRCMCRDVNQDHKVYGTKKYSFGSISRTFQALGELEVILAELYQSNVRKD